MAKGLSTQFSLSNGRFMLTEGAEKARDGIRFYTLFDKFRVYVSDFGFNFVNLLQKPVSYILSNNTLLFGVYQKGVEKYVADVKVNSIDVGFFPTDRKSLFIKIDYSTETKDNKVENDVIFV